jgi:hypothetical protein
MGESNIFRGYGSDKSPKRMHKGHNPGFPQLQDDIERAVAIEGTTNGWRFTGELVADSQVEQGLDLTGTGILHMSSPRGHVIEINAS